jgi:hypothetical protein
VSASQATGSRRRMTTSDTGRPPLQALERHLTPERLRPYREAAGGVLADALRLYQWNSLASGATYELLGSVEVLLRNALDRPLQDRHERSGHGGDWWDGPEGKLDPKRRDDARKARQHVRRQPVTHGRILAELTFGFWRYLLSSRYEATLWTPALRHGFPHLRPAARDRIYRPVDHLYTLRNRVAHHEPIHRVDLAACEDDAVFVVGCMDPALADWLRVTSRLRGILAERPGTGQVSGRRTGVGGGGGRGSAGSSRGPGR